MHRAHTPLSSRCWSGGKTYGPRLLSTGPTKIRSPFEVVPNSQMETTYSEAEVEDWLNEQELIATEEEQDEAALGWSGSEELTC